MGQIRFGDGIEDIKGSFGGVYFGRDSSGPHIRARPRTTRRTPTREMVLQRKWYSSKKYAEHWVLPYEPPPNDTIPPGTHCVYNCETLFGHRQPSLSAPAYLQANYFDEWPQHAYWWVQEVWKPAYAEWGLSKQLMWYMTVKYWYIAHYTWGLLSPAAFTYAKAAMLKWISASAAAVAVPLLTLWIGLVGLQFYFAFTSWLEGVSGHIDFNPGRVVIRKDNTLWWGGLVARPHHKMYDFAICQLSPFEGLVHKEVWAAHPYRTNIFYFDELWQTTGRKLLWWYVYTWQNLRTTFRGKGYKIGPNLIRMCVRESQHAFWNVPVGWERAAPGACYYLLQFDDHFSYPSNPKPPL